ncbi:hypothetical protein GCM10010274_58450 [Streptomyces lavendofoliae]|uniref:Uncharacterized protein n=1 Tax=Streptomyces lavendofoliae TaxID=67314 RepID=A0A918M7I2_9ACTN|nr:hypothetical protein GCM10010274_58450 [Streptomyces lavendofoliae]
MLAEPWDVTGSGGVAGVPGMGSPADGGHALMWVVVTGPSLDGGGVMFTPESRVPLSERPGGRVVFVTSSPVCEVGGRPEESGRTAFGAPAPHRSLVTSRGEWGRPAVSSRLGPEWSSGARRSLPVDLATCPPPRRFVSTVGLSSHVLLIGQTYGPAVLSNKNPH